VFDPNLQHVIQTSTGAYTLKTDQPGKQKMLATRARISQYVAPQQKCLALTTSMIGCVLMLITSSQHPHGRLPAYACALNNSKPSKLPTTLCRIISVQSKQSAETALFAQKTANNESKQLQMQARHGGRLSAKGQG
jgi:hypothetical protein